MNLSTIVNYWWVGVILLMIHWFVMVRLDDRHAHKHAEAEKALGRKIPPKVPAFIGLGCLVAVLMFICTAAMFVVWITQRAT